MGVMLGGPALSPPTLTITADLDTAVDHGTRLVGLHLDQVMTSGVWTRGESQPEADRDTVGHGQRRSTDP